MAYLLDANVFIQAKNLHYGLDFCPAFWEWLITQSHAGNVFSIEKVGDEVQALEDDLSVWAGARGGGFFLPVRSRHGHCAYCRRRVTRGISRRQSGGGPGRGGQSAPDDRTVASA
jgi:hypothetical protein